MIKLSVPFFPPSVNKAYYVRQGRMHLSNAGKKFKANVTAHVAQHYPKEMKFFVKNKPYLIFIRLMFEDELEYKTWPNKCETRYKKVDATNRVKLLEDALRDAFGIDDSQFIAVCVEKCQGVPKAPAVEIHAWSLEEERSPLDGFYA